MPVPYLGAPIGEVVRAAVGGYIWHLPRIFYPNVDRPSIWEAASQVPLAELPTQPDQRRASEALLLKGTAIARSVYDGLGRQGAAALLAVIRQRHTGAAFDAEGLGAVPELNRLLGDWLTETGMPGFHTSAADLYRLSDTSDGTPRYQIRVRVRNDEPVPGVVRISDERWNLAQRGTAPTRIAGHESLEIGWIVPTPPNQLWLHSHLSLNRRSLRIALPDVLVPEAAPTLVPFEGARSVDWRPARTRRDRRRRLGRRVHRARRNGRVAATWRTRRRVSTLAGRSRSGPPGLGAAARRVVAPGDTHGMGKVPAYRRAGASRRRIAQGRLHGAPADAW